MSFFTTKLAENTEIILFYYSVISANSVFSVVNSTFYESIKFNRLAIPVTAGEEIEREFSQHFRLLLLLFFLGLNVGQYDFLVPSTFFCCIF